MGDFARQTGVARLLAVGDDARHAVEAFGTGATWFASVDDMIAALRAELGPDVTVLIKGSRSNRLERVSAALATDGATGVGH
jgi:UDP-N-acetylmuramoyl-tripeptide--D-alanyl-D-alanine ligase